MLCNEHGWELPGREDNAAADNYFFLIEDRGLAGADAGDGMLESDADPALSEGLDYGGQKR
jgi:hypothetical protein